MATKITAKPDKQVTSLGAPTRSGYVMSAGWKVPAAMVKDSSKSRATELVVTWTLAIPGKDPKEVEIKKNEKTTKDTCNLNNFKVGKTTYTRNSFYPCHKSRTLTKVSCTVTGQNAKGKGKPTTASREFKKPRAPVVGGWSFDAETGILLKREKEIIKIRK